MHRVPRQMHRNLAKVYQAIVDQRPMKQRSERLNHKLHQTLRLLNQYGDCTVKPRLYSLHESEVVCISKGKAHTDQHFTLTLHMRTVLTEHFYDPEMYEMVLLGWVRASQGDRSLGFIWLISHD